jgi:hypothetical protein
MDKTIKQILVVVAISLAMAGVGYVKGYYRFRDATEMVYRDTLVVRDTIREAQPQEVRYIKTKEIIEIPVRDTIVIRDTTYILLNREVREYRDSSYYAKVSGYDPTLDYIEVYPKTTTITTKTIVQEHPSFRYAVAVGADYRRMGRNYLLPNISAELTIKKISVGVEVGAEVQIPDGEYLSPRLYIGAGLKYRLAGN